MKNNDKKAQAKRRKNEESLTSSKETVVVEPVKVKTIENKRNYFAIIHWIVGLYVMGALAMSLDMLLRFNMDFVYQMLSSSHFMTVELSPLAGFVRAPLIILSVSLPLIVPALLLMFIMKLLLNKLKIFTEKQNEVFLILLTSLVIMIVLSVYFS